MTAIIVMGGLGLAVIGIGIGARHLYFRLDRPGGFECSLRIVSGEIPGVAPTFRAGYAGPELRTLLWRRVAWFGPRVRIPITTVRIDRERRPARGERLRIPAAFSVLPITLPGGEELELALPRRRMRRLVALLEDPGPRR